MNLKTWAPLGVATVLGLVAAVVALNMTSDKTGHHEDTDTVAVAVATRDLDTGTVLVATDLKLARLPRKAAPAAAFNDVATLEGRTLTTPLTENVTIVPSMLADAAAGTGLPALLPPGMRAMTVDLGEMKGATEWVQPKSKVDLVTTITEQGQTKPIARTLLEDVTVMAVGQRMNASTPQGEGENQARTITLLLTPEQAELLELATTTTKVRVMIRNGKDSSTIKTNGTTVAELRSGPSTRPGASMVVARRNLEPGELLAEVDVTTVDIAPADKPNFSQNETRLVVGRVLAERVPQGLPVLTTALAPEGTPSGLAGLLPSGMRALTVDVDELKGSSDFIQPKSKVDLVTVTNEDGRPAARTLLEDIQVLATGSRTMQTEKAGPQQANTITLLFTPEQAETFELATTTTKVRLVLRNNRDASRMAGTTASLTSPTTQPTATTANRNRVVEVIRGGVSSKVSVEVKTKKAPAATDKKETVVDTRD